MVERAAVKVLKRIPPVRAAARAMRRAASQRELDLLDQLRLYAPNSSGAPKTLWNLTVQDASRLFPVLTETMKLTGLSPIPLVDAANFPENDEERAASERLAERLNAHGSDKATTHDYHLVYGSIFQRHGNVRDLVEVGLGTNNEDVVSNMSSSGRPGASLRAFRDFLPDAQVFGADIDRRILFKEDRIRTFFVDQTELGTFAELSAATSAGIDLVIDDGLHSPAANLTVFNYAFPLVRPHGWIVIEDIIEDAVPLWQVVGALLSDVVEATIVNARGGYMFVARKSGSKG